MASTTLDDNRQPNTPETGQLLLFGLVRIVFTVINHSKSPPNAFLTMRLSYSYRPLQGYRLGLTIVLLCYLLGCRSVHLDTGVSQSALQQSNEGSFLHMTAASRASERYDEDDNDDEGYSYMQASQSLDDYGGDDNDQESFLEEDDYLNSNEESDDYGSNEASYLEKEAAPSGSGKRRRADEHLFSFLQRDARQSSERSGDSLSTDDADVHPHFLQQQNGEEYEDNYYEN